MVGACSVRRVHSELSLVGLRLEIPRHTGPIVREPLSLGVAVSAENPLKGLPNPIVLLTNGLDLDKRRRAGHSHGW